jgi:hypothetical protein
MITGERFTEMALSFPGTEQVLHFERIGFKVTGKRMFATYLDANNTTNIFLNPVEQQVFCGIDANNIFPVPNKWGDKGATTFVLDHVDQGVVLEALSSAYTEIKTPKQKKDR